VECHRFPTFADAAFRKTGSDTGADPGRAGVPGEGPDGAFRVPTLRNIKLTAPYMHAGRFATLTEVIAFYATGGGRDERWPYNRGIDERVQGFEISEEETANVVAFLHALTDSSLLPQVPNRVPSGLPVLGRHHGRQKN